MHTTIKLILVLSKHVGEECYSKCNENQGKCDWCGEGLCCRKGFQGGGCDGSFGGPSNHQCVTKPPVLKHGGEGCWRKCNQKEGKCDWCGTEGLCCRKGYQGNGCDGSLGSFWNHQCVLKTTTATQSHYIEVPRWEIFMEQELRFGLNLGRLAEFPAFIASKPFDL